MTVMLTYVGEDRWLPGVPMRDLTNEDLASEDVQAAIEQLGAMFTSDGTRISGTPILVASGLYVEATKRAKAPAKSEYDEPLGANASPAGGA